MFAFCSVGHASAVRPSTRHRDYCGVAARLATAYPSHTLRRHKAHGSEYPAAVIPLTTQHYAMLARNLLYTGVTRGKRLVVLVGQKTTPGIAVRNGTARGCVAYRR